MKGIIYATAVFALALAQPVLAFEHTRLGHRGHVFLASANSSQVAAKVVMLNQRKRGTMMDFELRVEFDNVPQGKEYQFYLQDAGMKRDGLPPAPVPNASHRFVADSRGHLEFRFVLDQFSKGEWIQCTLRSTDRSIEKSIRFIPFK